jgi:hypothetical protein
VSGVVGTRASRRHGSRAPAHDQVRSACSRAVPTNVFQARNISYMPSILNLAISFHGMFSRFPRHTVAVRYIRTFALLRLITRYVVHRPGRDGVEININRFPSAWSRLRFRPQVPRSCRLTRLPAPDRTSCQ